MGKCPTVSIEKTDGCMMYLSKDSLEAEIVTAKSSEMNILVPKEDGDFVSLIFILFNPCRKMNTVLGVIIFRVLKLMLPVEIHLGNEGK